MVTLKNAVLFVDKLFSKFVIQLVGNIIIAIDINDGYIQFLDISLLMISTLH